MSTSGDVAVILHAFRVPLIRILSAVSLIAALAVPLASGLEAQETQVVSLDDALRMFAEDNLELRIARSRFDQSVGLARQAGAWPNPTLSATHEPLSGDAGSYSETYLTASQRLELSGSRGARSEAAARRRDSAHFLLRSDSLRLAFEVKRTYVEAVAAQALHSVVERVVGVFRAASRSANERYEAGDISLYALRRIAIERARYETRLAETEIDVGSTQRSLALLVAPSRAGARLVARPFSTDAPPAVPTLGVATVERRPEMAAAHADVAAAAAESRLMRAERLPDVTASGGFKRQSDGRRGAFLGLSAPLPLFDRGSGAVEAAEAGLRAAQERLALTRGGLENDVLRATETYRTLIGRSALLAGESQGEGGDLLDIALVAYEEGAMELVELLDAAEALLEARSDEARLRAALWIAYFDLERALGGFERFPAQEDRR
jgi:cobalt-zinc-cadmium efflux system outer membrane protein